MEYSFTRESGFNKKVFFAGLFVSIIINVLIVFLYGYSISDVKPLDIVSKEPKVKFLEIKEEIKKNVKEVPAERQPKKASKETVKKQKPSGKIINEKPVVPLATPVIPEAVQINEKEILLPEETPIAGSIAVEKLNVGNELEYKPVLEGKFNPSFGTKLSKFDETAFGPASGRLIVYKPSPPTIKTKLPPPPKVKVKLWINPDGTVDKVEIVYPKALGDIKLKQIIEDYVLSWKFNSISSNEKQWAVTTIRFQSKK